METKQIKDKSPYSSDFLINTKNIYTSNEKPCQINGFVILQLASRLCQSQLYSKKTLFEFFWFFLLSQMKIDRFVNFTPHWKHSNVLITGSAKKRSIILQFSDWISIFQFAV